MVNFTGISRKDGATILVMHSGDRSWHQIVRGNVFGAAVSKSACEKKRFPLKAVMAECMSQPLGCLRDLHLQNSRCRPGHGSAMTYRSGHGSVRHRPIKQFAWYCYPFCLPIYCPYVYSAYPYCLCDHLPDWLFIVYIERTGGGAKDPHGSFAHSLAALGILFTYITVLSPTHSLR